MKKRNSLRIAVYTTLAVLLFAAAASAQPGGTPPNSGNILPTFSGLNINDGATTYLNIASNGYISNPNGSVVINDLLGINTSPGAGLHLKGNGSDWWRAFLFLDSYATGGDSGIRFLENGTVKAHLFNNAAGDEIRFHHEGSVGLTLEESGEVGVNTVDPAYPLDVAGTINANKGTTGTFLRADGAEAGWYDGSTFSWGYGGTQNFFADRVGIGLWPTYLLDVAGTANFNSGLASGVALRTNGSETLSYDGTTYSWGAGGTKNVFADPVQIQGLNYVDTINSDASLTVGNNASTHLEFDDNEIQAKIGTSSTTTLHAQFWGGNFSVDNGTLLVDSTNNRVGIRNGLPSVALDVNGNVEATQIGAFYRVITTPMINPQTYCYFSQGYFGGDYYCNISTIASDGRLVPSARFRWNPAASASGGWGIEIFCANGDYLVGTGQDASIESNPREHEFSIPLIVNSRAYFGSQEWTWNNTTVYGNRTGIGTTGIVPAINCFSPDG